MSLRHIIIHCITLTFSKFLFICENQSDCEVLSDYGVHLCIKHQCIADEYVEATMSATTATLPVTPTTVSSRASFVIVSSSRTSSVTVTLSTTRYSTIPTASSILSTTHYSTIPTASSTSSSPSALSPSTLPSVQTLSAVRNETLSPLLSNSTLTSMQTHRL
jgi:hypothetical protein